MAIDIPPYPIVKQHEVDNVSPAAHAGVPGACISYTSDDHLAMQKIRVSEAMQAATYALTNNGSLSLSVDPIYGITHFNVAEEGKTITYTISPVHDFAAELFETLKASDTSFTTNHQLTHYGADGTIFSKPGYAYTGCTYTLQRQA